MNPIGFLALMVNIFGFIIMMAGIGALVDSARITFIVGVIIQVLFTFLVVSSGSEQLAWVMVLLPHLVIIMSFAYLCIRYQVKIGLVIVGWIVVFFGNVALSFNLLDIVYVDILSTIGKIIVYRGMVQPTFSFLADDLRQFILSGLPEEFPQNYDGGVILINFPKTARSQEIDWIGDRIHKNQAHGIRTILLSFYDLIEPASIPEDVRDSLYIVRIIPGHREFEKIFEKQVITINDDPSLIQIVLDDIISASKETTVPTEVLVYNLTNAIIIHGWSRIYSLILTKIPQLKAGKVKLSFFYYPEAHTDPSVVTRFEGLADEIIKEN